MDMDRDKNVSYVSLVKSVSRVVLVGTLKNRQCAVFSTSYMSVWSEFSLVETDLYERNAGD